MNVKKFLGKNKNGKNILILSGIHGNELTPIYTTFLLSQLDYSEYDVNTITILSSVNEYGIKQNTRDIPNRNTSDLNRMFDLNTEIKYKDILLKNIVENDIIIDIHSSPKCDNFILLNQDEYTNSYVDFCKDNHINYLIRYSSTDTIKKYCLGLSKISLTLELNMMNYIDYTSSENGKNIVLNIIKNIDTLKPYKSEPKYDTFIELQTYKEGIFIENVKCGDIITLGDEIGKILNLSTFHETKVVFSKNGLHRIICFGETNYVDGNKSICLLQPLW